MVDPAQTPHIQFARFGAITDSRALAALVPPTVFDMRTVQIVFDLGHVDLS